MDKLVKVAYENWENVVEYDGEALIGVKSTYQPRGFVSHTDEPLGGRKHTRLDPNYVEGVIWMHIL